jgi:hypothetical protein
MLEDRLVRPCPQIVGVAELELVSRVIRLSFQLVWLDITTFSKGYHTMSELRNCMIEDLKLAGLVEGSREQYVRAVHQLAAYYMISPDRLTERQVQNYILYVRDDLGVAKGTFAPLFAGIKFFYVNTLGYEWALFTKKKCASHGRSGYRTFVPMKTAAA